MSHETYETNDPAPLFETHSGVNYDTDVAGDRVVCRTYYGEPAEGVGPGRQNHHGCRFAAAWILGCGYQQSLLHRDQQHCLPADHGRLRWRQLLPERRGYASPDGDVYRAIAGRV